MAAGKESRGKGDEATRAVMERERQNIADFCGLQGKFEGGAQGAGGKSDEMAGKKENLTKIKTVHSILTASGKKRRKREKKKERNLVSKSPLTPVGGEKREKKKEWN